LTMRVRASADRIRLTAVLLALLTLTPGAVAAQQDREGDTADRGERDAATSSKPSDPSAGNGNGEAVALDTIAVEAIPQIGAYDVDGAYRVGSSSFAMGGTDASVKETPFTFSILDEDFLRDSNPDEIDELSDFTPGIQRGNQVNNSSQVFVSRGFQLGRDSILINGTRQSDGFAITPKELVSSIEFYRGPSSILSGQSPPGGAANIVTKKPLAEPFVRVTGEYDNHRKRKAAIDYNSGHFDFLGLPSAFRLNLMLDNSDTFREAVKRDVSAIAPVITLDLTKRSRLTLEANLIDWENTDDRGLPIVEGDTDKGADRFERSTFLLGTTDKQNEREQTRLMADFSHRFNDQLRTNLQFTYGDTERSQFSVFPAVLPASERPAFDPSTGTLRRSHFGTKDAFESIDARADLQFEFDTGILRHRGLAGLQFRKFERRDRFSSFIRDADSVNVDNPDINLPFLATSGPAGGLESDQSAREAFLQDAVRVTGGPLAGLHGVLGGRLIDFEEDVEPQPSDEELVGRAGIGYTPPALPALTVFGNYSESFDPQQRVASNGEVLKPEEGVQWEAGAKAEFLRGDLLVTATYFDVENTNVAASDTTTPDPRDVVAIGEQKNRGVEVEAVGRLHQDLFVRAQYTFNDSEIADDPVRAGNELAITPDHSGSIWARYDLPRFAPGLFGNKPERFSLLGGFVHVGDRFVSVNNDLRLTDYQRIDLTGRYTVDDRTHIELQLQNLTDSRFFVGGNTDTPINSARPGQPITVGFTIRHEF